MSQIKIYNDNVCIYEDTNHNHIKLELKKRNIHFELWETIDLKTGTKDETILEQYRDEIERIKKLGSYQTVDIISLKPNHPDKLALRKKFLSEHRHSEDEVRFFVDGSGLFFLHIKNEILEVLCERGDLISVPKNTKHWFDMGENPFFTAIRFFNNPDGWLAKYTGSTISENYISNK
jgi:1,2-dihydroxy-3-keto-5-methylthiopentene dioxygenase